MAQLQALLQATRDTGFHAPQRSDIAVPSMGESLSEGTIAVVLKKPGDAVAADEIIAQIETDKVTMDVRAPSAGVVDSVAVSVGEAVKVGQLVATYTEGGEAAAPAKPGKAPPPAAPPAAPPVGAAQRVSVPPMGDSISEGTIAELLLSPGADVSADQVIAQIETDKVTIDVRSPAPGVLSSYAVAKGDTVTVGQLVATVTPSAGGAAAPPPQQQQQQHAAPAKQPPPRAAAAPAPAAPPPHKPSPAPAPAAVPGGPSLAKAERRVPMTRLRKRVAERLKGAQNTYAMLSTFNEVDMTNVMALRADYKDWFAERHGVKLGFMSAFVKASVAALQEVPAVNGVIDGDDVVYRDYVDISVAVGTPKGLVVPVLRGCETLSFAGVEKAIGVLGRKARDGTLSMDEMAGGTFTISNGGVYGSLLSTPIINPPQSAILGMHAIVQRPVVLGGVVTARPIMNVALTYDHRLIDGREAVTFLKLVKELVEDPRQLLLR